MLFNSYTFLFLFLPVTLAGAFILVRWRTSVAVGWLVLASLFFYGWWSWRHVPLLLASIAFNYLAFRQGSAFVRLPAFDSIRRFIRHGPWFGPGRLGEMGDDGSIDRVGLGTLSDRLGEGADLRRIDHHNGEPRSSQCGRHHSLKAAAGLQRHQVRGKRSQPKRQLFQSGWITLDRKHFSTRTHGDVEAVLRNVDTNGDAVHGDPSLPNRASRFAAPATVRVQWNDGRSAMLSHGLQGPRARRAPASHRDTQLTRVAPC